MVGGDAMPVRLDNYEILIFRGWGCFSILHYKKRGGYFRDATEGTERISLGCDFSFCHV